MPLLVHHAEVGQRAEDLEGDVAEEDDVAGRQTAEVDPVKAEEDVRHRAEDDDQPLGEVQLREVLLAHRGGEDPLAHHGRVLRQLELSAVEDLDVVVVLQRLRDHEVRLLVDLQLPLQVLLALARDPLRDPEVDPEAQREVHEVERPAEEEDRRRAQRELEDGRDQDARDQHQVLLHALPHPVEPEHARAHADQLLRPA